MRRRMAAIITVLILLFSACGRQMTEDTEPVMQTKEIRWKLQEIRLPDADRSLTDMYYVAGEKIYRVVEQYETTCIQVLEPPYTTWKSTSVADGEWVEGKSCFPIAVSLHENSLQLLLQDREEGWYKAEWDLENNYKTEFVFNEYFSNEFFQDTRAEYLDFDETSYFAKTEGVQYFDRTFQEKKEWVDIGYVWQLTESVSEENKIYFCGSSINGGFRIWTEESREPVFLSDDITMSFTGKVTFISESEGYLCMPEGIWKFNVDNGELEKLMSFQNEGYSIERVYSVSIKENDNLLILAVVDGECLLLERMIDDNWQNKKELELVTFSADLFLKKAVADFNRQDEEYYIVLQEKEEDENWLDFQTRIQVEIGSGAGPAIVSNSIINIYDGARNGLLRNLTEDFADEKKRILENVWESGEVGGECFAIPYGYYIETLVTSADVVGERECWTVEEFMECVKSSGAEAAISRMDGSNLFWKLVEQGNVIDWKDGKSYFDSEEAVTLLEFSKEYEAKDTYEDAGIRVSEGRTLADWAVINSVDNFMGCLYEAMFQGKEVYIGYPLNNFSEGSGNMLASNALAINQTCKDPEGAIRFIRYLLTQDKQMELAKKSAGEKVMYILPVEAEALEYVFSYARELYESETPGYASNNGFEFYTSSISDESLEKIRKVLQNAKAPEAHTAGVETIVFEEVAAYFSESKSAQEVCATIQNRVQLYLDEMQ